jgi:3-deoxy-D-manno-octulosonic-acid transferase
MRWLLDALYLIVLLVLSPWLLYRALRTGKYHRGLVDKLFGLTTRPAPAGGVWFHGVSVGEIHLLRQVVAAFRRRRPDCPCVLSTTTDAGYDEALRCFPDLPVFFFPFDFSWAVRRTLRRVAPALVVLAEGELWPNFLRAANDYGVPVAVVNGRMSPRSLRRYRRLGWLVRDLFGRLDLLAMQTEEYAAAVRALGAEPGRVHVTGSVKYDGAAADRDNPRTRELRLLLNVTPDDLVWVAGSTITPEEEIVLDVYQHVRAAHPNLRLFLAPRQKDRFGEGARLLTKAGVPFVRRTALPLPAPQSPLPSSPVVLVDTIGELGALWGLADVAFVGGSLDGRRGGQNMIEPAAYGAAVVFGPHVWNFKEPATRLVECGGACRVADAAGLKEAVGRLLADAAERCRLGAAARQFVLRQQGATERTTALLADLLDAHARLPAAA